jgi:hypothetical protein
LGWQITQSFINQREKACGDSQERDVKFVGHSS